MRSWQFSHLEGRILTILETLNLSNKQEEATKSLMRQAIWQTPDENFTICDEDLEVALESSRKKFSVAGSDNSK